MAFLFDIRRFSVHDGPGIRTTVFFKGCPLSCQWCHNPESRNSETEEIIRNHFVGKEVFQVCESVGKEYSTDEIMKVILSDRSFYEDSGGGVTFSGGEPLVQAASLKEILLACKREMIHTAIDTSGYAEKKVIVAIAPLTDLFLYDIKQTDPEKHLFATGVSNELIFDNLFLLNELGKEIIIRIPMISTWNTDNENLEKTLRILFSIKPAVKRVDLLPYHTLGQSKAEAMHLLPVGFPETLTEDIERWRNEFIKNGFNTTIGG